MIELLALHHWRGQSELIDFAKGSDKIPESLEEGIEQIKRLWQLKKQ